MHGTIRVRGCRVGAVATGKISSVEAHGLYVTLGAKMHKSDAREVRSKEHDSA